MKRFFPAIVPSLCDRLAFYVMSGCAAVAVCAWAAQVVFALHQQ